MRFRTSLATHRLALVAAVGATAATACSGTVEGGSRQNTTADGGPGTDASASGGSQSGGSGGGGSGGLASGGTSTGGASTGGTSAGGTSAGGAGSGGTSTDGSVGTPFVCLNPVPLSAGSLGGGPSGGFVQCENGAVHRPSISECWSNIGPADAGVTIPNAPDGSFTIACRTNGDCAAAPHGYCAREANYGNVQPPGFSCVYGCVTDSDCAADQICRCADPVGTCVSASCKSDADCADGQPCRQTILGQSCGPSTVQFRCTPLCVVDEDCPGGAESMWCLNGDCASRAVCGRPFLVDGEARLATRVRRSDFGTGVTPDVSGLSPAARPALAAHYTEIGLMEHASIAAFARFSLELLSLGAPPDLLLGAAEALADETRHAQVCFGLASAYSAEAVGPGPLGLTHALAGTSVEERVTTAFLETCVGETLASVEVAEAAARATDPSVAALLTAIAADEARHAALGFRFVTWALGTMSDAPRRALEGQLRRALDSEIAAAERSGAPPTACTDELEGHGVLCEALRRDLRRAALREVVVPAVAVMLDGQARLRAA